MVICKNYYAFVLTYRLAFEAIDSSEKLHWVVIDEFMDVIFLIDILITFNKPYYDSSNFLQTDRK